ncbi:MAG: CoA transferase [Planctomycetes bacterium]|nr:CoA transferase [Planctomycetota bacterium]
MSLPLDGIVVLDLSRILAGPYCTMMLGDLGADVIKVERPGSGDDTRTWGPPFAGGEAAYYLCLNRNKRSLTLDLAKPAGRGIALDLARKADVLVENFSPGVTDKLGIDWRAVSAINPRLVYCSITGYGPDGPYRDRTGYDMVVSAVGGLMGITGEEDGGPVKAGVAITDVTTGLMAQGAITAALLHRERTGCGQKIDLSLLEAQVAALVNIGSNYLVAGKKARRWGTAHESIVPYQAFQAKDGHIAIAAANDKLWQRFCRVLGRPDLAADERYATNPRRVERRRELIPVIAAELAKRTRQEWMDLLVPEGIPCGPINGIEDVFNDPQVLHRGMLEVVDHKTIGKLKLAGIPVKYSGAQLRVRRPPPLLGEHSAEILREYLDMDEREIAQLREEGVI